MSIPKKLGLGILPFFLLVSAITAQAQQSYQVVPSRTLEVSAPLDNITIFDIYQQNLDSLPINIGWKKISIQLPMEWDYSMCEFGRCYAGIPDSSEMSALPKTDSAFLGLNIIPNGVAGKGVVKCFVYDVRYPDKHDTVTWIVTGGTAGVNAAVSTFSFAVSPNPSKGYVEISFGSVFNGNVQ